MCCLHVPLDVGDDFTEQGEDPLRAGAIGSSAFLGGSVCMRRQIQEYLSPFLLGGRSVLHVAWALHAPWRYRTNTEGCCRVRKTAFFRVCGVLLLASHVGRDTEEGKEQCPSERGA